MEIKDNGYVENTQAEGQETQESTGERTYGGAKEASAALGKFKDVDALLKAYGCLQAEFTRRSQRLKELERERENLSEAADKKTAATVEKLRQKAEQSRAEKGAFDAFVSDLEGANVRAFDDTATQEPVERLSAETAVSVSGSVAQQAEDESLETAWENTPIAAKGREALSSDELYEQASGNEQVRLKIIGEYLSSVGKSAAPLSFGGVGTLATPPLKAKTIEEAGRMALRRFRENGETK